MSRGRNFYASGYPFRGEAHGRAKLTDEKVRELRGRYRWRDPANGLAAMVRETGLGKETLRQMLIGLTWSHVR